MRHAPCDFEIGSYNNLPGVNLPHYRSLPKPNVPNEIQISIVAPLYNRGSWLETVLRSYLHPAQKFFPKEAYEVILIDDASTDNTKEVAQGIIHKYRDHNIRFYFLEHSRTYSNVHPSNCGYRLARGWIVMNTHMDVVVTHNVLDATWRHLNNIKNLWMNPRHYHIGYHHQGEAVRMIENDRCDDLKTICDRWSEGFRQPGYPHEFASSVRREYLMKIGGNDEKIIKSPADVDQWIRLAQAGVVYGEEWDCQSIHMSVGVGRVAPFDPKQREKELGLVVNYDRPPKRNSGNNWGQLLPSEDANMVATPVMRRILKR